MNFKEQFNNSILFFDGAMGTELQKNGLKKGGCQKSQTECHQCHTAKLISSAHKNTPCTFYAEGVV